ncbi:mutator type transposase [Tanacetum coccineum]
MDSGLGEMYEDYFFDEETYLEEVNVDMADYHFNIDADVEWVRHSESGQEHVNDPNPGEIDVIDNDNFESGTDSEDDGIDKIRRKKLKQIKKANESLKERVRLHSIETRRKLFLAKNDKLRIRAKCLGRNPVFTLDGEGPSNTDAGPKKKTRKVKGKQDVGPSLGGRGRPKPLAADECPWALQITKVKNSETWEVRTYSDEHKCLQSRQIHACTSKFLSKGIVDQIEKNPDVPIRALQAELQQKYELGVSRQKAFRAKAAALNQVKGDYSQQYTMLRDYCLELRRANPDTTIKIEVERDSVSDLNTRMFKRIYICLGPLKKGFKACGRDLLGLDGAFMKGPYPGQLLTAIGLDANNGIYPLAYAIVEKETTCSWTWFLECLGGDLGMTKESNFTFISDRQKGLAIAMANVFPCAEHRSCLRHIHENMKTKWNGQAYKELLWRCASATTVPYFDRAMEELKQFNKEAFEWLAKIPPHTWSRSHFSGRAKSDILLNNLCECFNGKILDARDAPIITALEYIREYLMRRMVNVIAVIKKTDGPLTPSATKLLKIAMDRANNYTVGWNGGEEYEVKGQNGNQCVVNVVNKVCSCRKWELTGIPCAHAIAANYNMALNGIQVGIPEEWVHKCYWLATWKHTYSYTLGCLNGRVMWKKSQIPTTLTPLNITLQLEGQGKIGEKQRKKRLKWKRPSDASTTPSTAPAKKKHATRSANAGKPPSTASAKKKQATSVGSASGKKQKKK